MTLPIQDSDLQTLNTIYPMVGIWQGLSLEDKKKMAAATDGAIRSLPWISSPFVADNDNNTNAQDTYNKILPLYAGLLKKTADNLGNTDYFFDEEDDSYIIFDSFLTNPRPKENDAPTDQVNSGRIAPIEYV